MIVTLDLFDVGSLLTLEVLAHKLLEGSVIHEDLFGPGCLIRAHGEEGEYFGGWLFRKCITIQVLPWNIWISGGFLMGPEHPES